MYAFKCVALWKLFRDVVDRSVCVADPANRNICPELCFHGCEYMCCYIYFWRYINKCILVLTSQRANGVIMISLFNQSYIIFAWFSNSSVLFSLIGELLNQCLQNIWVISGKAWNVTQGEAQAGNGLLLQWYLELQSLAWHLQIKTRVAWGHITRGDSQHYLMLRGGLFLLFIWGSPCDYFWWSWIEVFSQERCFAVLDARAGSGSNDESGCMASELCWQRMRNFENLKVFFTLGSWTKQRQNIVLSNTLVAHLPGAVGNDNKPVVWNVSPVLSLENWYNLFPLLFLDQTILCTRSYHFLI